jgi:hypothetical protein
MANTTHTNDGNPEGTAKQFNEEAKPALYSASGSPLGNSYSETHQHKNPSQDTLRWGSKLSPLKVRFWLGHSDAPESVKAQIKIDPALARKETCVLLPWLEAFTMLCRTPLGLFHFHHQDYDWQIIGWTVAKEQPALSEEECRRWPHLPANPTTADYVAEVMVQYSQDIDRMEERNPVVYKTLKPCISAWTEAATRTAHLQWPLPDGVVMKINPRKLFSRSYELDATGSSDINPFEDANLSADEDADVRNSLATTARWIQLGSSEKVN